VRTEWTQHFEEHPEELSKFPEQVMKSIRAGANHMGAPIDTHVDVNNEFMPAGQGVGAIKSLIPAGDLVRQIMAEAEQVIDLMKKFAK